MSFLKSYYNSVSSYLVGDEKEDIVEGDGVQGDMDRECTVSESKSEGWLSGMYNNAYNNTGEVWKAVKTDLSEFACVVSKDAKTVVAKTANGVKYGLMGDGEVGEENGTDNSDSTTSKIKASLNRMFEQVSKSLYIPPDSDDEDFNCNDGSGSQTVCSRIDTRIAQLQSDKNTFTTEPTESEIDSDLGEFVLWKDTLNMDDFHGTITELLKNQQSLLDNFTELVPNQVTFEDFWARYFYRVASVKAEESRREALKLRLCHEEHVESRNDPGDWDEADDINEEVCSLPSSVVVNDQLKSMVTMVDNNVEPTAPVLSVVKAEEELKTSEKFDVVMVKHQESSSASEDNNPVEVASGQKDTDEYAGWDDEDDEIDVEVTADDLELAKKVSDKDVLESKWEDWS